jgi:polyisoprenoid-binding protein YceI
MSTQQVDRSAAPTLQGPWHVDPSAGKLQFTVKTFWGLLTVKGTFDTYEGTLNLDGRGNASGELVVSVDSLDTRNAKRDKHLRSPDFLHKELHPTVRFVVDAFSTAPGAEEIIGDLYVGGKIARLRLPVEFSRSDQGLLRLKASGVVSREDVGMLWNRVGTIRGDVVLDGELDLIPGS